MKPNNRGLVNRLPISSSVDKELWEKFDKLSADTMIPKSRLLDRAIELVLIEYGVKRAE
jgi:hypothetical protein